MAASIICQYVTRVKFACINKNSIREIVAFLSGFICFCHQGFSCVGFVEGAQMLFTSIFDQA